MLKTCGEAISKPVEIIVKPCIKKGQFPDEWRKTILGLFHKKGNKQRS